MRIDMKHALAFALVAAASAPLAHGQDTPTFGDLEKIQANTVLLKAQVEQAKQRAELAKAGGVGTAAVSTSTSDNSASDRPVVSEVYGAPNELKATFLVSVGAGSVSIVGRAGSLLPGGCLVLSIATDAVRLRCAGRVVNAGFAGQAIQKSTVQNTSSTPFGQPFPSMPPVGTPASTPATN